MKTLLIILVLGLVSCSDSYKVQLIKNGSIVKAYDVDNRDYKPGDTVCLDAPNYYGDNWEINTNGSMSDTMYLYKSGLDSTRSYIFEQRLGVIKGED